MNGKPPEDISSAQSLATAHIATFLEQLAANFSTMSKAVISDVSNAKKALLELSAITAKLPPGAQASKEDILSALDSIGAGASNLKERISKNMGTLAKLRDKMLEDQASGGGKLSEIYRATFDQIKATTQKAMNEELLLNADYLTEYIKNMKAISTSSEALKKAATKSEKFTMIMDKFGLAPVRYTKAIAESLELFGISTRVALGAGGAGIILFLQQLLSFGKDATKTFDVLVNTGGLLNGSFSTSVDLTSRMQSGWVDFNATFKTMQGIVSESGFMLNSFTSTMAAGTDVTRLHIGALNSERMALASSAMYLAKMGPLFGMTTDQVGQAYGKLAARFHISAIDNTKAFDAFGKLAQGTGITMSVWTDLMANIGNTLRWVNVPMETLISQFSALSVNMQRMGEDATGFWRDVQPGEMIEMMKAITQSWQNMSSSLFLAMKPGALPTTITGYAESLKEYYTAGPIEAMKMVADRMTGEFQRMGIAPEQARMLISQMPGLGFQEMGRMAPRMLELLSTTSKAQLQASGMSKDMNKLLDELSARFPDQSANIEAYRQGQIGTQEPLQVLVRTVQMLFRWIIASPFSKGGGVLGEFLGGEQKAIVKEFETSMMRQEPGTIRNSSYRNLKTGPSRRL